MLASAPVVLDSLMAGLALALALGALEFDHYRTILPALDGVTPTVVRLVIVGKTLGVMLPGVLAAVALARLGWRRTATVVGRIWVFGTAIVLGLDLLAHEVTGNHVGFYLGFLTEADTAHWVGSPAALWPQFRAPAGALALPAMAGVALGVAATTVGRRVAVTRARSVLLAAVWAVLLVAGPVFTRATSAPFAYAVLNDLLPISWNLGLAPNASTLTDAQTRLSDLYGKRFLATLPGWPRPPLAAPRRYPNVIVVVLDGLRADVLNPVTMPRLLRWSRAGTRFDLHYSNSNASAGGMLGLVAGRYPFGLPKQPVELVLPGMLRRLGYQNHFFTSSDPTWGGIQTFLGPPGFTAHEDVKDGETHERDLRNLTAARDLVTPGQRVKFLVVFLMSSHWPYSSPARYADWTPDVAALFPTIPATATSGALSYLRAVRFLDDALGDWLDGLDLRSNLVVVTGDHGESLADDGSFFHGSRMSDVQTHVTFVMAGPGVPAGQEVATISEHVDVAPTIADLLGFPATARQALHGRALFGAEPSRDYIATMFRLGSGSAPRRLALLSAGLRLELSLGWDTPAVTLAGKLDAAGLPVDAPLTPVERETCVRWFDDFLARADR